MDPSTVADLQRRIGELSLRVSRLEAELAAVRDEPAPITEETLLAISAAVAAYLGERAKVRYVRLSNGRSWAREGRAAVQTKYRARPRR